MKRITTAWLGIGLLGAGPLAAVAALTEDDFYIRSAQDLVDLCAAPADDPLAAEAVHFCHGFASGAWQYYQATDARSKPFVCVPDPPPTRSEALAKFLVWAREPSRAEHLAEPAVETLFRFLHETWPCPEQAGGGHHSEGSTP
jgi:hypothetical protein